MGSRRSAHRRDGGLWRRARHARGSERRRARRRAGSARRDPADRDQPALGAGRDARAVCAPLAARSARRRRLCRGRRIADEDVAINRAIGRNGLDLIRRLAAKKKPGEPVNILTHCNAGWLATVDYGTATAPIYLAMEEGFAVHVYVDETRPRNQGASLTAWELVNHGTPHTARRRQRRRPSDAARPCRHGRSSAPDRTTANGDVCNKIGTYLKALAARDNAVPFYVALPSPTIDWTVRDGVKEIPIEERSADEVDFVQGLADDGAVDARSHFPGRQPRRQPRL